MRLTPLVTLAAAAGLLAACATPGAAWRAPAEDGPPWQVAESAGFEVWTADGPDEAARTAADLERLQATLEAAYPARRWAPRSRLRVVLLPTRSELAELTGPGVSGFFTRLTDPPTVVVDAGRARADRSVLAHELAHHLVERWLARPPRWLDEGLAEHLETLGAPATPPGTVGLPPGWASGWAPRPGFVRRALAWDGRPDPRHPRAPPSEAWALVHFLVNEEPARLTGLLAALERGAAPGPAFAAAFPEWSGEELLGAYRLELRVVAFLEAGRHRARRYLEGAAPAAVRVRAARPAEARLLRLELPRRARRPLEEVRAEVAAALREDPAHPEALRWRTRLDGLDPLPLARRAVEAAPGDWRAWRFLASALPREVGGEEREAALRRAVELAPGRPELLRALAQQLAEEGRAAEAAPLARQAAELAPWDPAVVTEYAASALALRACPVAELPASRAAALQGEPALDESRRALARGLAALSHRCELDRFAAAALEESGLGVGGL